MTSVTSVHTGDRREMALNLHLRAGVLHAPLHQPSHVVDLRAPVRLRVAPTSRKSSNLRIVRAVESKSGGGGGDGKQVMPNSNYVVPIDKSFSFSCISSRPLVEILRDLNKRVPENIVKAPDENLIPWYHANRMLSFYAPGWCGEVRDVIFSDNGSVTVVYRLTVRGSDGEAHRESTGTVSSSNGQITDPVAAAEEIAFCKACARFGLGLYLYHDE